jgi:urease accessory protein
MEPTQDYLRLLWLLQLADSALPIGTTSHSFGLETLLIEEEIKVECLEAFFHDYLFEVGIVESTYCRAAYALGANFQDEVAFQKEWLTLNERLSALKPTREVRTASDALGRRFLQLVFELSEEPRKPSFLKLALLSARQAEVELHHCIAFGLAGGVLNLNETATGLAYLQQSLTGLVSVCQRLMPLGQRQASQILWNLKPVLLEVIGQSKGYCYNDENLMSFTPLVELAGMRHPMLSTRLFIS